MLRVWPWIHGPGSFAGPSPGSSAELISFTPCSLLRWPFLSQIAIEADVLLMARSLAARLTAIRSVASQVRYLSTELIVMTFLVVLRP